MKIIKTLLLLSLIFQAQNSQAYSDDGHKIVAKLAWQELSPFARQNVERILGTGEEAFINAATWADDVKGDDRYDYLKPLHYVNLPADQFTYDRKRDCRKNKCVVQAILDFSNMAHSPSDKKSKLALRMLIHLIGDIHQPMHAGLKEDRGGNWFRLKYKGDSLNLHKLWDNQLVRRIHKDWEKAVELLQTPTSPEILKPAQWAEESHRLAMDVAYNTPEGKTVSESYLNTADKVTKERLTLAGWRLAMWLNKLW